MLFSVIVKDFAVFLQIVVRPLTLIVLTLTVLILYFAQSQVGLNRLVFEILAAVLSGVVGGLILNYITLYTGNSFLLKKSNSAIRNLQLIKFKIKNIGERISELKKLNNKRDFEEMENLVENINKDILNSISDWRDVNPNSEAITDFYEEVSLKEAEIKSLKNKKSELETQKEKIDKSKKEEISQLEEEISKKDKEISELNNQIFGLNERNLKVLSGPEITGLSSLADPRFVNIKNISEDDDIKITKL